MKLITRRHIVDGTEVEDKSKSVGRLLMIEIGQALLDIGTIKSIENTEYITSCCWSRWCGRLTHLVVSLLEF